MTVKQKQAGFRNYATRLFEENLFGMRTRFFGVPVWRARDPAELKEALSKGLNAKGPTIIEAFVDGTEYTDLIARNYK